MLSRWINYEEQITERRKLEHKERTKREAERNRRKKNSRWRTDTDMKTESRRGKQKANLRGEDLRGRKKTNHFNGIRTYSALKSNIKQSQTRSINKTHA